MMIIARIVVCLFFSKYKTNVLNGWGNRIACYMYHNQKMAWLIINRG